MAGRHQAEQIPVDAYKNTERRLYALPDLKEKVERDKAYIEDLQLHGRGRHSADIIRFKKAGVRLDESEIVAAITHDYTAKIARNEYEIETVESALASMENDQYFKTITLKYFLNQSEEEIAKEMHCDKSTASRNRTRLVKRLAVRLYGVDAL